MNETEQITALSAQLADANTTVKSLMTDAARLTQELDASKARVAELEASQENFNRRVAQEIARHGVMNTSIPSMALGSGNTDADLLALYQRVKGDPRKLAEFMREHGPALDRLMAAADPA